MAKIKQYMQNLWFQIQLAFYKLGNGHIQLWKRKNQGINNEKSN